MEVGGPVLPGTKGARGRPPAPTVGSMGRSPERRVGGGWGDAAAGADCGFLPKCGRGPLSPPLPSQRWKVGCVLHLYIFKVGRWAWNKHPRRALNCKKPLNSCLQGPGRPDSRERGVLRAPGSGWGRGSEKPLGSGTRSLARRRRSRCWGAPRRGRWSCRGRAPGSSLQGRGAWRSFAFPRLPTGL